MSCNVKNYCNQKDEVGSIISIQRYLIDDRSIPLSFIVILVPQAWYEEVPSSLKNLNCRLTW